MKDPSRARRWLPGLIVAALAVGASTTAVLGAARHARREYAATSASYDVLRRVTCAGGVPRHTKVVNGTSGHRSEVTYTRVGDGREVARLVVTLAPDGDGWTVGTADLHLPDGRPVDVAARLRLATPVAPLDLAAIR